MRWGLRVYKEERTIVIYNIDYFINWYLSRYPNKIHRRHLFRIPATSSPILRAKIQTKQLIRDEKGKQAVVGGEHYVERAEPD